MAHGADYTGQVCIISSQNNSVSGSQVQEKAMTSKARERAVVPLGTFVHPLGKIGAVGFIGGERYYWTVGHDGAVGMMPAHTVERLATRQGKRKGK